MRNGERLQEPYPMFRPLIVVNPLQESPEENGAYEQLLSHLGEIAEEGQFVAPSGAAHLRMELRKELRVNWL